MSSSEMNRVLCPDCQVEIPLVVKEGDPSRLVAFHSCLGKGSRAVYETDNRKYVSANSVIERINQSENAPLRRKQK